MVSLSCLTLVFTLHLPLLLLPLPVMGVVNRVQLLEELVTEEKHLKQQSDNHRQPKSLTTSSTVKVMDFGADDDMLPDAEGEYTSATLLKDPRKTFSSSFTICFSFMAEILPDGGNNYLV